MSLRPLVLKRTFRLQAEDIVRLHGSILLVKMYRNRIVIDRLGQQSSRIVHTWLEDNCTDFFFVDSENQEENTSVFFAANKDSLLFFMTWNGTSPSDIRKLNNENA